MSDTIVIGAGPAGLTAAYELNKLGHRSTLIESDDVVGGISRTVSYKGYRFDIGGHRFFSKVPLINELWDEILGEEFLLRPRLSRIHYAGKYFDYPLKAGNAIAGLGPLEMLLIGMSYTKSKLWPSLPESNFEQWVSNRFGKRLYQIFFKTYTEKVWGIPCCEISADWAAQRIKNLSLKEAVRNALMGQGKTGKGQVITSLIDQFKYPRLGPGMMWETCEQKLNDADCKTHRGWHVEKVNLQGMCVETVEAVDGEGQRQTFKGNHFISTMPLRELILALHPVVPDAVRAAAEGLRYRDFLTVVLIVKREDLFPDNWIYIHSGEVKMGRVQNYKSWSPAMVPDPTTSSLGLEYFVWETDDLWHWSDDRLVELGIQECIQIGLCERNEVIDGTVVRMPKAYPIYDHTYQDHLKTIRAYIDKVENLQTIGRNGQHRYNNQDHSMLTAVYAAQNIAGERMHDVWAVNVDQEYHEETRQATSPGASGERAVPRRLDEVDASVDRQRTVDQIIEAAFARLDPLAMGWSVGIVAALGLFMATAVLLIRGGDVVGPRLALLDYYFLGYSVSWFGAFIGMVEAAIGGFVMGYLAAYVRNTLINAYARWVKRSADRRERESLLERL